jgi:hypothetical protein
MKKPDPLLLARVDKYLAEMDALMEMLHGKSFLSRDERQSAQDRMKNLKAAMKADPDYGVQKSFLHIHAASNSNPINSHWLEQLGDARSDLSLYRYRLAQGTT